MEAQALDQKIISYGELEKRSSKETNFEVENRALKKIVKDFSHSTFYSLKILASELLKIFNADLCVVMIKESHEMAVAGEAFPLKEVLKVQSEVGSIWLALGETQIQFDREDHRLLQSLAELIFSILQSSLAIKVEKDNLERVFNSTPSASAIWRGEDLIFERVNKAYQDLFPGTPLEGLAFEKALPARIVRDYPGLFRGVLKTGIPFSIQEQYTPVEHYAGGPLEDHYYNINFVQLKNRDGSAYGVYQHTVDVTEQVEARKKAEVALAARDAFMGIASHELNTPLTSLKLQSQVIHRAMKSKGAAGISFERNVKFLDHVLFQVERLSVLVNDMLDVARITSGRLTMNMAKVNLTDLLKDAIDRFGPQFETVGCRLTYSLQESVMVNADPFRIDQVVTNLITNAIKYAPKTPVYISLRVQEDFALVCVKDGGQGILPENRSRIFERYERVISETNISGMGLGLFISRQIIEAHQGKIDVESEYGKGSTFYFKIPLTP